jgi:hypothetical protein
VNHKGKTQEAPIAILAGYAPQHKSLLERSDKNAGSKKNRRHLVSPVLKILSI